MKTLFFAAFMVLGMGAISPEVSFAEADGETFNSCAEDNECQNSKIDAAIAEQEREEADRRVAQEDPTPEHQE